MKYNAYVYLFILSICLGFNLLAIFWPSPKLNPILLIKNSLSSMPLFNFELNKLNVKNKALYGPFFNWPGRIISYSDDEGTYYEYISSPTKIFKIYGIYFFYEIYETYEALLNNGYIIKNKEECNNGFVNFGIIDTLNQKLCLPENLIKYPLRDIIIVNSTDIETITQYKNKGYNYIEGSDNMIFLYTNKILDIPIIGRIQLNGEQPCSNPKEYSWEKLEEKENMDDDGKKCETKIKDNLHDETYNKFGTISYDILYRDNLKKEVYEIYNKALLKSKNLYLFKNKFIGIDKECLKKSNIKDIKESINIDATAIKIMLIIFGGFNLIIIIVLICGLYNKHFNKEEDDNMFLCMESFYMVPNLFLFISNIIVFIGYRANTTDFNCSDEDVNNMVSLLNMQMLGLKIHSIGYNIFCLLFFIIAIIRICYKRKYKRNIFNAYFSKFDSNNYSKDLTDLSNNTKNEVNDPLLK